MLRHSQAFKFFKLCLLVLCLSGLLRAQESYIVAEAHSGKVLLSYQPDVKRPVASLAKIATAMVALDWAKFSGAQMNQVVVVPNEALRVGGSNPMALYPGDRIELREAVYSMLLGSDSVAAYTIADHVGRSIASRTGGSPQTAFVREMNNLASALGMTRTNFSDPHGMGRGKSTARDMAKLSIYAMRSAGFRFYVKQKSRKIASYRGSQRRGFTVKNTNSLLGQLGISGIKSGASASAGPCVALSADKSPLVSKQANGTSILTQRRLIVIVLGSSDRWARGKSLIQSGWSGYQTWISQGRPTTNLQQELLRVPTP